MSADKIVRALARVLQDEIKANPDFGRKLAAALQRALSDEPAPKAAKAPEPAFNPLNVVRNDGTAVLRRRLRDLTATDLKTMIAAYGLDKREAPKASAKKAELVAFVAKHAQAAVQKEKLF